MRALVNNYVFELRPSPFGSFCDASDGAHAMCPCGNAGAPSSGCNTSQGTGGVRARVEAFDPIGLFAWFVGTGFPPATFPTSLLLRAPSLQAPIAFGDGVRCLGPSVTRLGTSSAIGGASAHLVVHNAPPATYYYQLWFRNNPASYCDATAAFNVS